MEADSLSLDMLPYDCLFLVCEILSAEDLVSFSKTCKLFHEVATAESLWRQQVLHRWLFCDIHQISSGPNRWRRYFAARRRVEARMDQGAPGRDYRVKTLRGHKSDVVCCVCLGDANMDWEHPQLPLVVSLAQDGTVIAWNAKEGKAMFTLEEEHNCCLAGMDEEIAIGSTKGHVTVYNTSDWSIKSVLTPPSKPEADSIGVNTIQYAKMKKVKDKLLIVSSCRDDDGGLISLWSTALPDQVKLLLKIDQPCYNMAFSSSGWLASINMHSKIFVWNVADIISSSSPSSPLPPLVTLHPTGTLGSTLIWLRPGQLASYSTYYHHYPHILHRRILTQALAQAPVQSESQIWDITKHLQESKKRLAYQKSDMYNPQSIKLPAPPTTIVYANGVLVMGDEEGKVRVVSPLTGECLSEFKNHKGAVTDLHVDRFRILSCSKDYSIRVYQWLHKEESDKASPQCQSCYQLLGGSVALKTHDGFRYVSCEAGSCVGVAGNMLKLYNFSHQLTL